MPAETCSHCKSDMAKARDAVRVVAVRLDDQRRIEAVLCSKSCLAAFAAGRRLRMTRLSRHVPPGIS